LGKGTGTGGEKKKLTGHPALVGAAASHPGRSTEKSKGQKCLGNKAIKESTTQQGRRK